MGSTKAEVLALLDAYAREPKPTGPVALKDFDLFLPPDIEDGE